MASRRACLACVSPATPENENRLSPWSIVPSIACNLLHNCQILYLYTYDSTNFLACLSHLFPAFEAEANTVNEPAREQDADLLAGSNSSAHADWLWSCFCVALNMHPWCCTVRNSCSRAAYKYSTLCSMAKKCGVAIQKSRPMWWYSTSFHSITLRGTTTLCMCVAILSPKGSVAQRCGMVNTIQVSYPHHSCGAKFNLQQSWNDLWKTICSRN